MRCSEATSNICSNFNEKVLSIEHNAHFVVLFILNLSSFVSVNYFVTNTNTSIFSSDFYFPGRKKKRLLTGQEKRSKEKKKSFEPPIQENCANKSRGDTLTQMLLAVSCAELLPPVGFCLLSVIVLMDFQVCTKNLTVHVSDTSANKFATSLTSPRPLLDPSLPPCFSIINTHE